jgi:hypothetical protein
MRSRTLSRTSASTHDWLHGRPHRCGSISVRRKGVRPAASPAPLPNTDVYISFRSDRNIITPRTSTKSLRASAYPDLAPSPLAWRPISEGSGLTRPARSMGGELLAAFGRRVRELRGLTQEPSAALSGLHRTYIGASSRAGGIRP